MNDLNDLNDFTNDEPTPTRYLALPTSKPMVTYILLGAIVVVWLLMSVAGGSTNSHVLVTFGANYGPFILQGQVWRFFTSMFLHIGLTHLFFNSYALLIFGAQVEGLYGSARFIVIYTLAGIFGSLASFATHGAQVLSAGASGAIFGIIGMNLMFFLSHRQELGQFGRQQISSILFVIGINLLLGFTIPGIDNMAHLGGLATGAAMGFGLSPRYQILQEGTPDAYLNDTVSLLNRWWVTALAMLILVSLTPLAIAFWR